MRELIAIIRSIVDAAGQHGEEDGDALIARIERAVWGYLSKVGDPASGGRIEGRPGAF